MGLLLFLWHSWILLVIMEMVDCLFCFVFVVVVVGGGGDGGGETSKICKD